MDDFLAKKKETGPALDMSKSATVTKDDFKRLMEKVPDFKIKPEKVHMESIKIKEKNFKFKSGKKDLKAMKEPYTFLDPLPKELKNMKINEMAAVPIDWKMLTTIRPKTKVEENFFSRLIELGKSEIKTRNFEKRQFALDPQIRKTKNKAGVIEMRVVSCDDCGEDFCNGKACNKVNYDSFARVPESVKAPPKIPSPQGNKTGKFKRRMKKRSKSKNKSKQRNRSGSPKKNTTSSK